MAPILKDLPRASFDKIEFPFTSRTATLEARTHIHEYPKMAGGSVEKLGRKLWSFSFDVPFHTTFANYPDLYPGRLDALTERCAKLDTATLLVPEIGEIRCILTRIERKRRGGILSGEDCTLAFLEDDLEPFRKTSLPDSKGALAAAGAALIAEPTYLVRNDLTAATIKEADGALVDIFSILDEITGLTDVTTLVGLQVQGKLAQLRGLARKVHDLLRGAPFDPIRRSLRNLWYAANALSKDLDDRGAENPVRSYTVPTLLSAGQVAQRLYKDASRGGEVLALNRQIADPYAIPAGTRLLVYTQ